jgi:ElaB/YqjD/DUF883 family membrane-anchored ribosome-binding protein
MSDKDTLSTSGSTTDDRRPEDIERDLNRTRANLSGTLEAISSKLTPGQMMDQAMQYMRTSLPADFSSNLATSVRNNPIPVALIGVGIAWMAMSGRRGSMPRSHDEEYGYVGSTAYMGADDALGSSYDALGTTDSSGMYSGTSGGTSTMGSVKDKARDMKQQAQSSLGSARERVADTLASTRDRVSNTMHSTRERMGSTVASARESMHHLSERSAQTYGRARDSFSSMVEEQPLILAALGIAAGAAIGAALPRTRQEDQLLGETRDNLMHRAGETARTYADQAADKARSAVQTVTDKAHHALDQRSGEHAMAASETDRPRSGGTGSGSGMAGGGAAGGMGGSASGDRAGANVSQDDAVSVRTTNVRAASSSTNDDRPI